MYSFDYQRPSKIADAVAQGGGDARYLAGGQSLIQSMRLRLASASTLVDLGGLAELRGIQVAADTVTVDYVGVGYKSQKVFDSSYERGAPATFPLTGVIPGWTEGVAGMKPGGARLLLVPSELAYGEEGRPPAISPNEALAFIVEMDSIGVPSAAPTQ